jgi:hypothetical protein
MRLFLWLCLHAKLDLLEHYRLVSPVGIISVGKGNRHEYPQQGQGDATQT